MKQNSTLRKKALVSYSLLASMLIGLAITTSSCNYDDAYSTVEQNNAITESKMVTLKVKDLSNLSTSEQEQRSELIKQVLNGTYSNLTLVDNNGKEITISAKTLGDLVNHTGDYTEDIPFTVVDVKPMFAGCESAEYPTQCFKEKLDQHVHSMFHYPEEAQKLGKQGRVYINFRINTDGSVTIIGTRGPDKSLEAEAKRIIEALPTFIPGKNINGEPTSVTFAYPIVFKLT